MTNWWIVVNIPGWLASRLTHLPETSAITSYRRLTRYTDDTFELNENVTGMVHSYGVRVVSEEEHTIQSTEHTYPCSVRHINVGNMRTTEGILHSTNTTYWNIHTVDGVFQVHKTTTDDASEPIQWTVEMWGEVPDADNLLRVIRKHISS